MIYSRKGKLITYVDRLRSYPYRSIDTKMNGAYHIRCIDRNGSLICATVWPERGRVHIYAEGGQPQKPLDYEDEMREIIADGEEFKKNTEYHWMVDFAENDWDK